jgi:5-methylcytosine-specific restriction endonuclease McrA
LQKARRKKYFEENKDKILERCRKWYAENSGIHNQRVKDWHQRNPDKRLSYVHTRRARKLANGGSYSVDEWNDLKKQCGYSCMCCGRKEPAIRLTVDHIVPIAKGGSNDIGNIQPLCMRCNKSKATKTINYLMGERCSM